MTNREWLMEQMQNMSDDKLAEMIIVPTEMEKHICVKEDCMFRECEDCLRYWLKYEHKEPIKLSEAERVILENIDKEYKWICKNLSGDVWFYAEKPIKDECVWWYNPNDRRQKSNRSDFPNLFQFVKWEDTEPYNIEELLRGDIKDDD